MLQSNKNTLLHSIVLYFEKLVQLHFYKPENSQHLQGDPINQVYYSTTTKLYRSRHPTRRRCLDEKTPVQHRDIANSWKTAVHPATGRGTGIDNGIRVYSNISRKKLLILYKR